MRKKSSPRAKKPKQSKSTTSKTTKKAAKTKKKKTRANKPKTKKCSKCGKRKALTAFGTAGVKKYPNRKRPDCKECNNKRSRAYHKANHERLSKKQKAYRTKNAAKIRRKARAYYWANKQKVLAYHRQYNITHKAKRAEYRKRTKEHRREYAQAYDAKPKNKKRKRAKDAERKKRGYWKSYGAKRYHSDPKIKLRTRISGFIRRALLASGGKKTSSILDYLEYSIAELKSHIEQLFEPWMDWDNWGNYNPRTWDDNDPSTWKWQLDHIIPQSTLPFASMAEENFRKCWALGNLRPYSAKKNILEGCKLRRNRSIT